LDQTVSYVSAVAANRSVGFPEVNLHISSFASPQAAIVKTPNRETETSLVCSILHTSYAEIANLAMPLAASLRFHFWRLNAQ